MKKKLAAALSGAAALVLALSGCGDDGEEAKAWAKEVCDKVKPQIQKIQQANAAINKASQQNKSPEEIQETDAAAFGNISEAYGALAQAVKKAPTPPVDNGAELEKNAVEDLKRLSEKYAGLKKTVEGLDTKDQAEFAEGLKGVAKQLGQLGKSGDKSLQKLQSGELGEAMAQQKGCQKSPGATPES